LLSLLFRGIELALGTKERRMERNANVALTTALIYLHKLPTEINKRNQFTISCRRLQQGV